MICPRCKKTEVVISTGTQNPFIVAAQAYRLVNCGCGYKLTTGTVFD